MIGAMTNTGTKADDHKMAWLPPANLHESGTGDRN